jgi:nitrite reductase/ring-hydroxylating ferredoxin subunit/DMSO/TMAO reductase YedYZ heme-binding membrane subunit
MTDRYVPIGWSRTKFIYDAILVVCVVAFLVCFNAAAQRVGALTTVTDQGSLPIRSFGLCALLLMTVALAIGPLARIDKRFLPLLYNRRHLGVVTFGVAAAHVFAVFDWYLAFSPIDPWLGLLVSDTNFHSASNFPYLPFGSAAFLIISILAATSHDFWLKFLGPGTWKLIHTGIYVAYALVIAHVCFGALQSTQNAGLPALVVGGAALLLCLHITAALRERAGARMRISALAADGWLRVGPAQDIEEGRAKIVSLPGHDPIAVFRHLDSFAAISHRCAHQNGPLGEGRVIKGRVVCPWHGHEFKLRDGCAPAPFTDRVPVYPVRVEAGIVFVDPVVDPVSAGLKQDAASEGQH